MVYIMEQYIYGPMEGATANAAGTQGLTPAPSAGDNEKFLRGDGTWATAAGDVSGKADKVTSATSGNFAALDANGNLTDSGHKHSDYLTSHQDISGKADKVTSATNGNFAALDSNGNLTDSGNKASDFVEASDFFATEMPLSSSDNTAVSQAISSLNTNRIWYGECQTTAATQAKEVTISGFPTTLETGIQIRVRFRYGQTYNGQPTLNVNSTGAFGIGRTRWGTTNTTASQYEWRAGGVLDLMLYYDSETPANCMWIIVNGSTATANYFGKVKLSDSYTTSGGAAADAVGASSKALIDGLDAQKTSLLSGIDVETAIGSVTVSTNVTALIYTRVWSTTTSSGAIWTVLGSYNASRMAGASSITCSRSGNTYTFSSTEGKVMIFCFKKYIAGN